MLSDDYLKGWRNGISEAKERANKKFKEFIKRLKGKTSENSKWNNNKGDTLHEIIDKLAGSKLTSNEPLTEVKKE